MYHVYSDFDDDEMTTVLLLIFCRRACGFAVAR